MRYVDWTYPELAANLALDEALLSEVEESGSPAVLRIWEFPSLAVVMGASCRIGDDLDLDRCRADRLPLGRRSSGGGTVLIGPGALNLTVVLPVSAAPELKAVDTAQIYVLERVAASLRRLKPGVEVKGLGDLALGGRKFSGSAQRRLKSTVMVHASLLYRFPIEEMERYLQMPTRQPSYREGRSHREFVTSLDMDRGPLIERIRAAWPEAADDSGGWALPGILVERLLLEKFSEPTWIERL